MRNPINSAFRNHGLCDLDEAYGLVDPDDLDIDERSDRWSDTQDFLHTSVRRVRASDMF